MNANLLHEAPAGSRIFVAALGAILALVTASSAADTTAARTADEKSPVKAAETSPPPSAAVVPPDGNTAKPHAHALPKRIEEVVKMVEAGVSQEIVRGFVNNSGIAYAPSGADIIAMKERGVPDEVTVAMLSRGATLRQGTGQARNTIAAPAIVRTLATDGRLDPESYEFFWYHYAYPRALSASYETLSPSVPTYSHYPYGLVPYRTDGFPRKSFVPGLKAVSGLKAGAANGSGGR